MGCTIWVFGEERDGALAEASIEVVCEARRLADRVEGGRVEVVLVGGRTEALAPLPAEYGADRVFWAQDERLARYSPERFTAILAGLIGEHRPPVFLLAATDVGKDLGPRVAARVRTALFPACDRLDLSPDGLLILARLSHGRKLQVTAVCRNGRPQMATVLPGTARIRKTSPPRQAPPELVKVCRSIPWDAGEERIRFLAALKADPATVDVSEAEIIVAGGKGAGGPEGFQAVRDLAEALGASVAGSRMAVDAGCIDRERQIGQSGRTVSPELLISCGISGANAHVAGMRDARTVVSINEDRNAPIHKLADLGVVGDLHRILPLLTERLKIVRAAKAGAQGPQPPEAPRNSGTHTSAEAERDNPGRPSVPGGGEDRGRGHG